MKKICFLGLSLFSVQCIAQPIINKLFDYVPGDSYSYKKLPTGSIIDTATIPSRGANLTWDMTQLQFDPGIYTNSIIDYASSLFPTSFNGCTYVFKEYIGLEQYYRKSGDTILYMGNSYSPNQYTPNPPVIKFPGTYGTGQSNVYGPVTTNVVGSGVWTYFGRYNAYGTLKLPGTTLTNVALYVTHGGLPSQSFTDYMWVRENEKDPLLRIQFQHLGGNTTVNLGYATLFALGVEQTMSEFKATVSPNPCADVLSITAAKDIISISVYDISGRSMTNKETTGKNATLDISTLNNGVYFVKITAKDGAVQTSKVIKGQ